MRDLLNNKSVRRSVVSTFDAGNLISEKSVSLLNKVSDVLQIMYDISPFKR